MGETSNSVPSPDEHVHRLARFDEYAERVNARPKKKNLPLRCPCCSCKTLERRANFEICEVCFWEDDGQDDQDAAKKRGGPNGLLSLQEARTNYLRLGACEESMVEYVRSPRPEELPKNDDA